MDVYEKFKELPPCEELRHSGRGQNVTDILRSNAAPLSVNFQTKLSSISLHIPVQTVE